MLRKTVIYIMVVFALFSAILPGQGMTELLKVPTLIEHYRHHIQDHDGEQLSFASFLWMHYGDSSSHKTEESHDDLPLFHQCCVCQFYIAEEFFEFNQTPHTLSISHPKLTSNAYFHKPYNAVFQPPRFSSIS